MTPLEIIRQAQAETLIDEDGHGVTLEIVTDEPCFFARFLQSRLDKG